MWHCSAGRRRRAGDLFAAELVEAFDIKGISKSPAIFDIDKLKYFNSAYIRAMTPEQFAAVAAPYIRQTVKNPTIDPAQIAPLLQQRCEVLTDIPEKVDFFDALPEYDLALYTNKNPRPIRPSRSRCCTRCVRCSRRSRRGMTRPCSHP